MTRVDRRKNWMTIRSFCGDSTAGLIRDIRGCEGICVNLCMQPKFIDKMLQNIGDQAEAVARELT